MSRDEVKNAKAQMEINLARHVKYKKRSFYYIGNKRRTRENAGPLLNETGDLATQVMENTAVLNATIASAFTSKTGL